jgi:3-oxoacyl-[acyl-carrier-protein] synthase III
LIEAVLSIQAARSAIMAASLNQQSLDEAIAATYSAQELAKAERLVKRFNIPGGASIKLEDQVQLACALKSVLGNDARVSQKLFESCKPQMMLALLLASTSLKQFV